MGRSVFSLETERDKDLETLAATEALCAHNLRHGQCTPDMCKSCNTRKSLDLCLNELPACDRLRVRLVARQAFSRMVEMYPTKEEKDARKRKEMAREIKGVAGTIGASILILVFFISVFAGLFALLLN